MFMIPISQFVSFSFRHIPTAALCSSSHSPNKFIPVRENASRKSTRKNEKGNVTKLGLSWFLAQVKAGAGDNNNAHCGASYEVEAKDII